MVETNFCIEDILKNQGIIKNNVNGNKNNNKNGNKNKNASWNKGNQHVVNDGVVDTSKSSDQAIFRLSDGVHAIKLQAPSQ